MSSKYLQRKCSDQDHGEVHLAHPVLALDSAWDAEVSWERGHCLEGTFVQNGSRDEIKHKPKSWPG